MGIEYLEPGQKKVTLRIRLIGYACVYMEKLADLLQYSPLSYLEPIDVIWHMTSCRLQKKDQSHAFKTRIIKCYHHDLPVFYR